MNATISKSFRFEAAHRLPNVAAEHKCVRLHGHSYRVTLEVSGPVDGQAGWVMDFGQIAAAFEPIRQSLDHCVLNDVPGLDNPTSELIAHWMWQRLKPQLPLLSGIIIQETPDNRCEFRG